MTTKKKTDSRGFASMSEEKMRAIQAKGKATRLANTEKRRIAKEKATKLRDEADQLYLRVEELREEADSIDGDISSDKTTKARKTKLYNDIDEMYRGMVSPQYLEIMKNHAWQRGLNVEDIVTPSHAAMDILHDPDATTKERDNAIKTLQQYENARPVAKEEEVESSLGSVQEELDNLMTILEASAPKR